MEIALTTNDPETQQHSGPARRALIWKAWQESRGRFFAALVLLVALVAYVVLTGPGYISRHNARFPDKPLVYSIYVWSGLFYYALQGLWMICAFVLAMGGLARERAIGVALFTLGLPVKRLHLFLIRAAMAWGQAILLAVISALLIPVLSRSVGEFYPATQALMFGMLMSTAGGVILAFGLLLSETLESEFTAPVIGLCVISAVFFSYKAHTIPGWNVFNVMSGAAYISPGTQLLTGAMPWLGLSISLLVLLGLLCTSVVVIRARDL
jgi:ABC-type transport system involved in multi-copper enzyme maturation permease subunit